MHHYYTENSNGRGCRPATAEGSAVGTYGRRPAAVRSAFMRSEEIDRERAMSGWNPYYGEEEIMPMQPGMPEGMVPPERWETRERMAQPGMPEEMVPPMQPYFMQPDYAQVLEEQKMAERDLRMLQSMYPEIAKMLLPYIEEECDKMEYEGSTMYDEYPDPTTVQRLEQRIFDQVKERIPETMEQPEQMPEDVLSMQYQGNRRRQGRNWPNDLIRILLLQEMHHRRCRRRGCRRGRG